MEISPISLTFNSPDTFDAIGVSARFASDLDVQATLLPPAPVASLSSQRDGQIAKIFQCDRTPSLQASSAHFIRKQYWDVHGATLGGLMYTRFAIVDDALAPTAVVGIKHFDAECTLVEKYLDAPMEAVIGSFLGTTISRGNIAEVGNLAAQSLIQSCRLIVFLLHWLSRSGTSHAVCTGTEAVRLALRRAQVPFITIGDADASRLGDARFQWGSYYDNAPQVLLIDIAQGLAAVSNRYRCAISDNKPGQKAAL